MVHLKNIIKGILASAVFFMAVQVGVAQEKVVASAVEDVEMTDALRAGLSSQWVQLEVSDTPTDPADQIVIDEGNNDPDCDEPSGEICAVELNYDPFASTIAPLLARIGGSNPPTVEEFINAGATYTGPGNTPVYTHKQ